MQKFPFISKSDYGKNLPGNLFQKASRFFKSVLQPRLNINQPNDIYEQEADDMADKVMRMAYEREAQESFFKPATLPIQRKCDHCEEEERKLQRKENDANEGVQSSAETYLNSLSGGQSLADNERSFFDRGFGYDFGNVRVHTDTAAAQSAKNINALAYTCGNNLVFNTGQYRPKTDAGKRLLAHELTHVVQQNNPHAMYKQADVKRQSYPKENTQSRLTAPLTDSEWRGINVWLSYGEVGIDALTDDPANNALVMADAIFCSRLLFNGDSSHEDPLLCLLPDVTRTDPRVIEVARQVSSRGPIINWSSVSPNQRILYVMNLLVGQYHYPENATAGLLGNIFAESGVIPSRIEGSAESSPMNAPNFHNQSTQFTPDEVMNRNSRTQQGPNLPGIGLAQWTSGTRRSGLFRQQPQSDLGVSILFNMDGQVSHLVNELQSSFPGVNGVLTRASVSVNDASDEVVYNFETPGTVIDGTGHHLPRSDPGVQAVFGVRRRLAQRAVTVYQEAHR